MWMFRLVRRLKTDSKRSRRRKIYEGSDGRLCFSEKERGEIWMDCIERIMIQEHDWDHNMVGDAVEGSVVCIRNEEVLQALNEIKTGEVPGPSEVS